MQSPQGRGNIQHTQFTIGKPPTSVLQVSAASSSSAGIALIPSRKPPSPFGILSHLETENTSVFGQPSETPRLSHSPCDFRLENRSPGEWVSTSVFSAVVMKHFPGLSQILSQLLANSFYRFHFFLPSPKQRSVTSHTKMYLCSLKPVSKPPSSSALWLPMAS